MKNLESYYRGVTFAPGDTEAIVQALSADPVEVYQFRRSMLETIEGMLGWRQWDSAIEAFTLLCDVLREVIPTTVSAPREKISHDNSP